jgi:hypothetical protein
MAYHHTQVGTMILVTCVLIGAVGAAVTWRAAPRSMIGILIILAAVAVIFNSLTVEIDGRNLRWYFGPGWWTYRLALSEIQSATVVRNRWWNGFGIRSAPRFTLYNVSGLDAVELKLKSGEIRRIGTDDPKGLATALQSAALGH